VERFGGFFKAPFASLGVLQHVVYRGISHSMYWATGWPLRFACTPRISGAAANLARHAGARRWSLPARHASHRPWQRAPRPTWLRRLGGSRRSFPSPRLAPAGWQHRGRLRWRVVLRPQALPSAGFPRPHMLLPTEGARSAR